MKIVRIIPLLIGLLGATLVPLSLASEGESSTNGTTDVDLNYLSIRGNIYSASPKRLGTDGWGAKLSVRASMGIHRFETLDDLLRLTKANVATVGIEPKLILAYPVPYLDDVNISPRASFEILEDYSSGDTSTLLSTQAGLALTYNKPGYYEDMSVSLAGNYGSRYAYDGLNPSDFAAVSIEATSKHYLGFSLGKYKFVIHPYGKYGYYFESLLLETPEGDPLSVRNETEIGAKIQTDPRWKIWKLKMPRIKVSYTFGDGVQGLKIKFST
jgi:hypothetical protein